VAPGVVRIRLTEQMTKPNGTAKVIAVVASIIIAVATLAAGYGSLVGQVNRNTESIIPREVAELRFDVLEKDHILILTELEKLRASLEQE
jgi:hypothetical protein